MHLPVNSDASLESMEETLRGKQLEPLDPSRTLSPSSVVASNVEDHAANPFFVIDWFKHLRMMNDNDAPSSFKTPQKQAPPSHPSSPSKLPANSPFRKQSEAVGAGWNAKGLQKARKDDWEGALQCWEMALEIRSQVLGENHKDVSNTHNNLGISLGRLGREEEAMVHLQKALQIRTSLYGRKHQDIAATHHNIGNVRQQTGDYAGALESFEEARRIQEELQGSASVQVARAYNAIGHLHFEAQHYTKARDAYSLALATFRKAGRADSDMEVAHTKQDLQEAEDLLLP